MARKYKNPLVTSGKGLRKKTSLKRLYTIADDPNQESLERLHTILEERNQREIPLSRDHLIKYTSKKQNYLRPMRKSRKQLTNQELRAKLAHNLNNMHKVMVPIQKTRRRQEENKFNDLTNQELRAKLADNFNKLNRSMNPIKTTQYKQEIDSLMDMIKRSDNILRRSQKSTQKKGVAKLTNQELRAKLAHNLNNMHNGMVPIQTTRYKQDKNSF